MIKKMTQIEICVVVYWIFLCLPNILFSEIALHCFAVLNNSQSRYSQTSLQSGLYTQCVNDLGLHMTNHDFSQHVNNNTFVFIRELRQSNQHTQTFYSRGQLIGLNKAKYTMSNVIKNKLLIHSILKQRRRRRRKRVCREGTKRRIRTIINSNKSVFPSQSTNNGINKANLIKINTSNVFIDCSRNFKLMYFNSQSDFYYQRHDS